MTHAPKEIYGNVFTSFRAASMFKIPLPNSSLGTLPAAFGTDTADRRMTSAISDAPRLGFSAISNAAAPDTKGVASDVPVARPCVVGAANGPD